MPQHRHVIADLIRNPEVRGRAATRQNNNQSPSPLMGEESKVRVKQDKPTDTPCHSEQSEESKISEPYHPTLWIPAYAGMTAAGRSPSGLRIKSAMTVMMAGMTLDVPHPMDTALKPV